VFSLPSVNLINVGLAYQPSALPDTPECHFAIFLFIAS
jgi:hypothetical protein